MGVDVVVADRAPGVSGGGSVVDLVMQGASNRLLWISPGPEHRRTKEGRLEIARVAIPPELYKASYLGVGAARIWPTLHGIDSTLPESDEDAYLTVNEALADTVAATAPPSARVMVQDYSVLLVVPVLRRLRPDLRIAYVHHTPWPAVADVADEGRRRLLRSLFDAMRAADVVCVSAQRWASQLAGWGPVHTAVVPPGVAPKQLRAEAAAATEGPWAQGLRDGRYERPVIAVVGRADPAKNADVVVRGWRDLVGRGATGTLCLHEMPTSRASLPLYASYARSVANASAATNAMRLGSVIARASTDRGDALRLLQKADVVVVGSLTDGWNLVAAEAAVLGGPRQQLVLSAGIGAIEVLRPRAWVVDDPGSVTAVADSLRQALTAPPRRDAVALPMPTDWWRGVTAAVDAAHATAVQRA